MIWESHEAADDARVDPPPAMGLLDARVSWVSRVAPGLAIIELPRDVNALAREVLAAMPDVEGVYPDAIGRHAAEPNDPAWPQQFADYTDWRPCLIQMWERATGSTRVIAVVDSGVNFNLADLNANLWRNPGELDDGIDNDNNGIIDDIYGAEFIASSDNDGYTSPANEPNSVPLDVQGHGTQIASVLGANGDNNLTISGVLWHATIMPVKISSSLWAFSDVLLGIDYAVDEGARIVNCSFAFHYTQSPSDMEPLRYLMMKAGETLFVAAAGNVETDGRDLDHTAGPGIDFYPAEFDLTNLLVVGNMKSNGGRYASSCFGHVSVDVFAPGTDILSLDLISGAVIPGTGTSLAAPICSAIAAIVWDQNPSWTPKEVANHIRLTGDITPELAGLCVGINGQCVRVNPSRAVGGAPCP